jgi:hypothetical protein
MSEPIHSGGERIPFGDIDPVIMAYQAVALEYNAAVFVNGIHDGTITPTVIGKDLEDWKVRFPREDDEAIAQLEEALDIARSSASDRLKLSDPEALEGLAAVYNVAKTEKELRSFSVEQRPDSPSSWHQVLIRNSSQLPERTYIKGLLGLMELTGESYAAEVQIGEWQVTAIATPETTYEDIMATFSTVLTPEELLGPVVQE